MLTDILMVGATKLVGILAPSFLVGLSWPPVAEGSWAFRKLSLRRSSWQLGVSWVGEPRLLSSRNSSKVTISLLGEAERGRPPVWTGAAPLFWTLSWGTGPFRSGGYSWRLRTARPGVLGSLLGIRSELLKLSQRLCRRSEEPLRLRGELLLDVFRLLSKLFGRDTGCRW